MDSDHAKLFIGGISHETTEATLQDHFCRYGAVLGSTVAKDRLSGIPRGFGFLCFSDPSSADKALQDSHVILGRKVDVKRAKPRRAMAYTRNQQPMSPQQLQSDSFETSDNRFRTRKIFVGGLSATVTELEFKNYFERFGRVTDVVVMMDSATHRPRGFGFITFDSEDAVENVMQKSFHEVMGKVVEVKRAVPREESHKCDRGYQTGSHRSRYMGSPTPTTATTYGVLPTPALPYAGIGGFTGGPGVFGGWYPASGYTGVPYGIATVVPQAWMYPYGNTIYPAYMSSGGWVAAAGGHSLYSRVLEPAMHQRGFVSEHAPADLKSSGVEGEKADVDA